MTYNIHPIFVHFPIALLFIYSIIKVLPLQKWLPTVAWRQIERAFLLFGVLGAFAALATGDTAEHFAKANRQLVNVHAFFASAATWIYGILLFSEIVAILNTSYQSLIQSDKIKTILLKIEAFLCTPFFSKALAILGFIAIFIAGLLGGVIVYGTSADPLAGVVLKLLGINL